MDINRNNYETFFLNYLDRELSPADRQSVEKFIGENTDLQNEFLLLQQTILSPAEIVFEPKASLFREEKKRRIIPFYRLRVAAAVAVLILGSWYMKTVISPAIKVPGDAKKNAAGNIVVAAQHDAKKNTTGSAVVTAQNDRKKNTTGSAVNTARNDSKKNTAVEPVAKNRSKTQIHDESNKLIHDQSDKQNQDRSDSRLNEEAENEALASTKSTSSLEIQSGDRQTGIAPDQLSGISGAQKQTLIFAATKSNDPVQYKNAAIKEQDFQNDNAISVVGLNDRNKAITGFFKKLTKRAPADENARKLRVSVFQISY